MNIAAILLSLGEATLPELLQLLEGAAGLASKRANELAAASTAVKAVDAAVDVAEDAEFPPAAKP